MPVNVENGVVAGGSENEMIEDLFGGDAEDLDFQGA